MLTTVTVVAVTVRGMLFLAALVVFAMQIKTERERWYVPSAWVLAMLDGLAYTTVYLFDYIQDDKIDPLFYNDWSRVLWIHVLVTLLAVELYRLAQRKRGINGC
jgi:hypothetical protein